MPVKLLFIGDIIGKPGRQALSRELDRLVDRYAVDLVIANGENAAGGFGLTVDVAKELFRDGIDCLTSGNHIWDKKEQVQQMVMRLLQLPGAPSADAADALACAICHAHGGQGYHRAGREAFAGGFEDGGGGADDDGEPGLRRAPARGPAAPCPGSG